MSVHIELLDRGALAKLTLDNGKGNIVDAKAIEALSSAVGEVGSNPSLAAVVLAAAGSDFSFGASVEEHLPQNAPAMLTAFHKLIGQLVDCPVPVLAAVRGRCLGGGLELVLAANRIFAHPSARLGQPEIHLGVFAPPASVLLQFRVSQPFAEELLLTGRLVDSAEALARGLVDELCGQEEDPAEVAITYARKAYLPLSPSSLRFARRAARTSMSAEVARGLAQVERLYLNELMATEDAKDGIEAFMQKRPARWKRS